MNLPWLTIRAIAHRNLGNSEAALKDMSRAIDVSRDMSNIYFARAVIRKEMGDMDGAVKDYNKAIIADSAYTDALYNTSLKRPSVLLIVNA